MTKAKETKEKIEKAGQDAAAMGQENVHAFIESGNILARGAESLFKTCYSWSQTAAERNTQAFKSLLGCKSLSELTELQTQLARQNLDDFLSGTAELSALGVKVAQDAMEPISDQFGKTLRRAQDAAAA